MTLSPLISLASILFLGILAQWLAWRLHVPSILFLLLSGFLIGPILGVLQPDALFGDILLPVVSLSVALILFEGGMSLEIREWRAVGHAVRNLVTIGALVTWVSAALAAHWLLNFNWSLSVLLGAILIVTGPTVVIPMLRQIRPVERIGGILKWEGILIDPVGALVAVLVFEVITIGEGWHGTTVALAGLLKTTIIGVGLGGAGALLLIVLLKRHWVPDFLQNPMTLMIVLTGFVLSNLLQEESGLFTVTLMGIILANQKAVTVKHIIEFKENLRVLLISVLFIVLSARLEFQQVARLGWSALAFLAVMILISRPLSVFAACAGSGMNFKEKLFVSWMAPRGIVAAAVSSVFALELAKKGVANAEHLVSVTFIIIIGTILVYGPTAAPLARRLGLADPDPQGLLLLGAHPWAVALGVAVQRQGFPVLMVDSNYNNIQRARMAGLRTYYGNALYKHTLDEINLSGIGRMLALTSNDEVNSLAVQYYSDEFGMEHVYQLAPSTKTGEQEEFAPELLGRILFSSGANHVYFASRVEQGAEFKVTPMTEEFPFAAYLRRYPDALPMFVITEENKLIVLTADDRREPKPGEKILALVKETANA
ncbi:MAG: sodium:proton antiporter [candidate division KSB1 bacterium]|nr:sodium:proton antiporter [candidate division KSB1 bacterium]